jgi:hypothetical protein
MRQPDVKTLGRGNGAGAGEAGQASNLKCDSNKHGPTGTAPRRTESIRCQVLGQIGGA